jgi:hypothetical protein
MSKDHETARDILTDALETFKRDLSIYQKHGRSHYSEESCAAIVQHVKVIMRILESGKQAPSVSNLNRKANVIFLPRVTS